MEYTIWPDSSDPPVDMRERSVQELSGEDTLNGPFADSWDGINTIQQHPYDTAPAYTSPKTSTINGTDSTYGQNQLSGQDLNYTEKWEAEFANLASTSLDEINESSFVKFPVDSAANAPIQNDYFANQPNQNEQNKQNGNFGHDINSSSKHLQPSAYSPQHRRGLSDAYSMRVPLVEPSHHDEPVMARPTIAQISTDSNSIDFSEYGENFNSRNSLNVFQTPVRLTQGGVDTGGNRHSPTLARDSPSTYLAKGLESPMEFNNTESPYLSYQSFPNFTQPQQPSNTGRRMTASSVSSRRRRTSSSASQQSFVSTSGSIHDPLEQPDTPLSRSAGNASSTNKPLSAGIGNESSSVTPRPSSKGNPDWETPRVELGERPWNTPNLSMSPLSTHNGQFFENASMRTPSVTNVASSVTPSGVNSQYSKSRITTPSLPPTPALISPSLEDKFTNQSSPSSNDVRNRNSPMQGTPQQNWKKDGRRRIGRKEIEILEDFFHKNPHPERSDREHLAELTKLEQRTVQIWFQNRRAKTRALKMPPSRADQSEEANQYRAAAAAASNAAATALTKRRNVSPTTKTKGKSKSSGTTSSGSPYSGSRNASVPKSGSIQRSQSLSSPLNNASGNRNKTVRPPVSRSRSATNTHRYSLSASSPGLGFTSVDTNGFSKPDDTLSGDFWAGDRQNAQQQNSLLPRPASMGNLGNIPENMQQDQNFMWLNANGSNNSSQTNSSHPLGYHQQLSTAHGGSQQFGSPNAQAVQRMQQIQRLQYLKQLKQKNHVSAGGVGTRERSASMFEPMTHLYGEEIDTDLIENTMNGAFPSRSGSMASLNSINSAIIPPSPMLDPQGQFSPDLRSMHNSPDMVSNTWSANALQRNFFNDEWGANDQRFSVDDNMIHWSAPYESNNSIPESDTQIGGISKGGHQGLNTFQPEQRSRQPSIRLQLDESNNSAQLVVVPADNDPNLPRFSDETDWVHGHLTKGGSEDSPGRAESAAKLLIGERVASTSHETHEN